MILYRSAKDLVASPILRVTNVTGGSSAATAGIQTGDYLHSYDGQLIDSVEDLGLAKTAATEAGKTMAAIVIFRGPVRLELEMATGQMGVNLSSE